jgi:hypothetical protein
MTGSYFQPAILASAIARPIYGIKHHSVQRRRDGSVQPVAEPSNRTRPILDMAANFHTDVPAYGGYGQLLDN